MKLLSLGSKGAGVRKWQFFLTVQGLYHSQVNGVFDENTNKASRVFQRLHSLKPDGKVGDKTIGVAKWLGLDLLRKDASWPPKPPFDPLVGNKALQDIFGKFSYRSRPLAHNLENIVVTDNWVNENIVFVNIPQLSSIKNGTHNVAFHKKAKNQLEKLWNDWEKAGLIHLVKTWDGSYSPRFRRGSKFILSNHAFGSAFDINTEWNKYKEVPALAGRIGSVRELVKIANNNGFYWGGHFPVTHLDGMHFEIAFLKSSRKKKPMHWRKKKSRFKQGPPRKHK